MFNRTTTVLASAACALALAACTAMPAGPGMPMPSGDAGVTAAAEKLRVAMVDPDRASLEALVAEDLSYGHSGGRIDTRASFVADLLEGRSDFVSIAIVDQTVKVSRDVAVIRHTLNGQTNDSGKPGTVSIKVLQVWQWQGGQWKLLARQAVRPA